MGGDFAYVETCGGELFWGGGGDLEGEEGV